MNNQVRTSCWRFLARWDNWWLRPTSPHLLALLRIAIGITLLLFWGSFIPAIDTMFSVDGLVFPFIPEFLPSALHGLLQPLPVVLASCLFAIHIAALVCVTLGIQTRTSVAIALLISIYYYFLVLHNFVSVYNRFYVFSLAALLLADSGEVLSYDALKRYGSFTKWKHTVSILPIRLIAVQVTLLYFGAGLEKMWLPWWQGGNMLWFSLTSIWGTALAYKITQLGFSNTYHAVVHSVIILQVIMPFLLWNKQFKWIGFLFGFLFHLGVGLLLSLWWFMGIVPLYLSFLNPERVEQWCERKLV